jgi:hypothetical protein
MEKAFKRLYYVSIILSAREEALQLFYSSSEPSGSICEGLRAKSQMDDITVSAEDVNISEDDSFIEIGTSESELAAANQNNLENSCASIY